MPKSNPSAQNTEPFPSFELPGDKSITHRAIFFRALHCLQNSNTKLADDLKNGLIGLSEGEDCLTSIDVLKQLVRDTFSKKNLTNHNHNRRYNCQNSGTTARLLPSLISSDSKIKGDQSLSKRPMNRVYDLLQNAGAEVRYLKEDGCLPVEVVRHATRSFQWQVSIASAQLKTLWFLSSLKNPGKHTLSIATGSRTHTETMLKRLGAEFSWETSEKTDAYSLEGPQKIEWCVGQIPKDPSALAFWVLAYAIGALQRGSFNNRLLLGANVAADRHRLSYIKQLAACGFEVGSTSSKNSTCVDDAVDLEIKIPNQWSSIHLDRAGCAGSIDEIPVLVLLAAMARGESVFENVSELRYKEADRLAWLLDLLTRLGVESSQSQTEKGLKLVVSGLGRELFAERLGSIQGQTLDPLGDHRLAMIAAVLSKVGRAELNIPGPECMDVSYPGFLEQLSLWVLSHQKESGE